MAFFTFTLTSAMLLLQARGLNLLATQTTTPQMLAGVSLAAE